MLTVVDGALYTFRVTTAFEFFHRIVKTGIGTLGKRDGMGHFGSVNRALTSKNLSIFHLLSPHTVIDIVIIARVFYKNMKKI